jgi:hypothetical protein
MVAAISGLAASRSRGLGGEITAGLLAGAFQQNALEHQDCKQQLKDTRNRLDAAREALANSRTDVAVLAQKLAQASEDRHLRNLLILVGSALIGFAIDSLRNGFGFAGFVLCVLGALLVILAWFGYRSTPR